MSVILLTPLFSLSSGHAYSPASIDTLQIHGFASQGFIQTSENRFFGKSENGSFNFRELGLNASFRPHPDLQFSVQALSRHAEKGSNGEVRLDYGFIDYSIISTGSNKLGFRLGRIKNPLGFYNDTRDVAFTRPSILLPQSIYFDRTRNLALSSDGITYYSEHRINWGNLFYQLGVGFPNVDDEETTVAFLGHQRPGRGRLEEKTSYVSRFIFEKEGGRVRLGLSGAIVNIQFNPPVPNTGPGHIRFSPLILSAQYNAEFWSLTSEYALRRLRYRDVNSLPESDLHQTGESYYLQGAYRVINNLEGFIRYDALFQSRDDRLGNGFFSSTGRPGHTQFAKDWTIGLRWDITDSLMSRIEYHTIDGTGWLAPLDNPVPKQRKRRWDLFSILFSYHF